MEKQPLISVVIPAYNGGKFIEQCLNAVLGSSYPSFEVILVDDCSTDDTIEISRKKGVAAVNIVQMAHRAGPGAARNYGARTARGDILLFVDADVVVQPDTLARVALNFEMNPGLAAVFGSYDDDPPKQNFLSQYKNIFHHFVHQEASSEATTFWAGCGAVDRKVFEAVGGFDGDRYPRPSIEDIELGYRIRSHGHRILLDKKLQVKHLKEWRLGSLLRTDILNRAVPWTKLILERQEKVNDLNLKTTDRLCGVLVGLVVVGIPASFFKPLLLVVVLLSLSALVLLNWKFYKYLYVRRGGLFVGRAFLMHLLYYLYSSTTFALCWGHHLFSGKRSRRPSYGASSIRRSETKVLPKALPTGLKVDGSAGKRR